MTESLVPMHPAVCKPAATFLSPRQALSLTRLTPMQTRALYQTSNISLSSIGIDWTNTSVRGQSDRITSKFWRVQELARLKADTPEVRRMFYDIVSTHDALLTIPGQSCLRLPPLSTVKHLQHGTSRCDLSLSRRAHEIAYRLVSSK